MSESIEPALAAFSDTGPALPALPVKRVLEAALLAAGQPLSLTQLAALFPEDRPVSTDDLRQALQELDQDCAERGVELVEVASGYRYQVRREIYPWVSRLWTERQTRYSRALLETLALIAYRQPITRGEIEQIRGVAVSSQIVKTMEERDWIRVVGHRDVPGKPALLGTTRGFLDYFGLKSLDQLPPLAEIRDIPDPTPELPFAEQDAGGSVVALAEAARRAAGGESAADRPQHAADGADDDAGPAPDEPLTAELAPPDPHDSDDTAPTGPEHS